MSHPLYPLLFEDNLHVKVWGGSNLSRRYGKTAMDQPVGESWEVSAVSGKESVVAYGPVAGRKLDDLVRDFGESLLGKEVTKRFDEFPLLLKLLDASDNLSVQVHPNAEQAARLGGGALSKSEAWLILHTDPGSKLVIGVAEGLDRRTFEALVAEEKIEQCLRWVEVSPGDLIPIEPGTLHAIGKGVVLLELQETSDTTYRFYDYNRPGLDGKPRQLHVTQALEVVSLDTGPAAATPTPVEGPGKRELLLRGDEIEMQRWSFSGSVPLPGEDRFILCTTLSGDVTIRSDSAEPEVALPLGRSALIPAGLDVELCAESDATLFLGAVPVAGR